MRTAEMDGEEETTTLTPSMTSRMFIYKDGRRYSALNSGVPLLPNDDEEIFRLELQHRAIIRTLGGLHSFPGESFDRALDAGCGPGWWAIDFADAHPSCEVIGVDIVPIQPQEIPPNLTFECDDICQGLRFPDGHFDVIYSRNLCASITDWRVYLKELVRVLRPGGFLNCIENDLSYAETHSSQNTALAQWNAGLIKTYDKHNLNPRVASELSTLLTECGLVDVQVQNFVIPGGSSPRSTTSEQETADLMTQVNMLNLNAMSNPFGIANDVHDEELSLFISEVRRDLLNPAIDWQIGWTSWMGIKP